MLDDSQNSTSYSNRTYKSAAAIIEQTSDSVEQQHLLALWNDTHQHYPLKDTVPQLIAAQASLRPHATALVAGGRVVSYGELNRRANQLAHYLQKLGVEPEVLVGMCLARSPEMVIGLLGIMKAGGAYIPLDPNYPLARLEFMLQDARVSLLITQQSLAERFAGVSARVIYLDSEPDLTQQSIADPVFTAVSDNLVYVIYTSGSTGQPKGVLIEHKSLVNLVYWHQHTFAVTSEDRVTQVTSPAFDATGWELWPYLCAGASVYLVDEEIRTLPVQLRDWLIANKITISFMPTSLAESLIALEWPAKTFLRYLLTGADALQQYPPATLPFALVNNYGPTEATVVATSEQVFPVEQADMPPSIGRPIANTQIFILDEDLQQVAIGELGELHIGGIGLARGYLNRPELTREKFIPHQLSSEAGARLYKTGDLARFLPDGRLAFIGRIDHQIKIRGYRIEPGEIMTVLNRHPAIYSSLVIAREDVPGEKHLVAYLVLVPEVKVTASTLRKSLSENIPDYMIPASFVVVESLPLNHNSKIDLAALPAPDASNTLHGDAVSAPSSPVEEWLATMIAGLLDIRAEQIGIDDNFFLLGGNSLMGTQIIMRISEAYGIDLPLLTLFQAPTIRQLAAEVESHILAKLESMNDEEVMRLLQ